MEEAYDIESISEDSMVDVMSRKSNSRNHNDDSTKSLILNKGNIISSETCVELTPEEKDFWNSLPNGKKALVIGSAKFEPKHKPSLSDKTQMTTLKRYSISAHWIIKRIVLKMRSTWERQQEDSTILSNYTVSKNANYADLRNVFFPLTKKEPSLKIKVIKASSFEKNLEMDGMYCNLVSQHITWSTSKVTKHTTTLKSIE